MNRFHERSRLIGLCLFIAFFIGLSGLHTTSAHSQSSFDCSAVTEIPTAECTALVSLYDSTDGNNWVTEARAGWLQTTTPCSWEGVACENGRVTQLDKNSDGLSGDVPAEIGALTNLTALDLGRNALTSIPAEIGNLANLTTLQLAFNSLSSLPDQIGNLSNLEELAVDHNRQLTALPTTIGNLSSLMKLFVVNNGLTSVPAEIGNLTNLTELWISGNRFTTLPTEIGNLTNLIELDMGNNQLTALPSTFGNLSSLERLHLSGSQTRIDTWPAGIASLDLDYLNINNTCEPTDTQIQTWLDTVFYIDGRGDLFCSGNDSGGGTTTATPTPMPTGFNCSAVTEIPTIECEALVALYHSTGGDNWYEAQRAGWLQTSTPCSWDGITCENGSVTEFVQYHTNISGELPPEIGNLSNLTNLTIHSSNLTAIPAEIENLSNLTHLEISHSDVTTLPTEIGNLPNLTHLSVKGNELMTLPIELSNLTTLKRLDVHNNDWSVLPAVIWDIPNMITLTIGGTGDQSLQYPDNLSDLSNLTSLSISSVPDVPVDMWTMTNLTSLELFNANLMIVPSAIGNLTNLTHLDLGANPFTMLPPEIGNLTNLRSFYVQYGELLSLPPEIGDLTNLETLYVFDNNDLGSIPPEIGNLTNLSELAIFGNGLTSLPPEIGNLANLDRLHMSLNPFATWPVTMAQLSPSYIDMDEVCEPTQPELQAWLNSIESVYGRGSAPCTGAPPNSADFSCASVTEIPMIQCEALVALYNGTDGDNWYENQNTGWLQTNTPCSWNGVFCQFGIVLELNLDGFGASGALPPEIGNLSNLTYLNMDSNRLTSLPAEIGNLSNLRILAVGNNSALTSIPPEIGNLWSLTGLYIYNNYQLTSVPAEIGNLSNLTILSLYGNRLTSLPAEIGNLSNLRELWARYNLQLTALPAEIGNLSNLTLLDVAGNQLTTLPTGIGNLSYLTKIYAYQNQLTSLPSGIGNLSNLAELSLYDNQLTSLPSGIGNLSNLTELSLYENQLTSLPAGIGNSTYLRTLLIGDNRLTTIPAELGNLYNLNILSLNNLPLTTWPDSFTALNVTALQMENVCEPTQPALQTWLNGISDVAGRGSAQCTGTVVDTADFSCANITQIPTIECEALVALYNGTDGDNWAVSGQGGWLRSTTPCEWSGITCENGVVTKINKYDSRLSGAIPAEIGNLSNLTELSLYVNQVTSLPAEIGNLSNLTSLEVGNNQLTTIPDEIGNLVNADYLGVGGNQLTELPPEVGNMAAIETLVLIDNPLTMLPPEIGNLSNLIALDIDNLPLTAWPDSFANLNLTVIWMEGVCEPTQPELQAWLDTRPGTPGRGSALCTGTPPEPADFSCANVFPIPVSECEALVAFYNATGGDNWNEWAKPGWLATSNPCTWNGVSCSGTHIVSIQKPTANLVGVVPAAITDLPFLETLLLGDNQLSGLPYQIGQLSELTVLDVSDNQLSLLPAEMGDLVSLSGLNISDNPLTTWPDNFANLNLTTLSIENICAPNQTELQMLIDGIENVIGRSNTLCSDSPLAVDINETGANGASTTIFLPFLMVAGATAALVQQVDAD